MKILPLALATAVALSGSFSAIAEGENNRFRKPLFDLPDLSVNAISQASTSGPTTNPNPETTEPEATEPEAAEPEDPNTRSVSYSLFNADSNINTRVVNSNANTIIYSNGNGQAIDVAQTDNSTAVITFLDSSGQELFAQYDNNDTVDISMTVNSYHEQESEDSLFSFTVGGFLWGGQFYNAYTGHGPNSHGQGYGQGHSSTNLTDSRFQETQIRVLYQNGEMSLFINGTPGGTYARDFSFSGSGQPELRVKNARVRIRNVSISIDRQP